jgi:hypothetical protein
MVRQLTCRHRQDMTGQILNLHPRPNQESAVVDDQMKVLCTRLIIPTNPLVPRLQAARRRTKTQHTQHSLRATNQVTQLRSAQLGTQGMELLKQLTALAASPAAWVTDQN